MGFPKQLFGITIGRDRPIQKLARSNRKTIVTGMDYEKGEEGKTDDFLTTS
jgi:hypothetical protein